MFIGPEAQRKKLERERQTEREREYETRKLDTRSFLDAEEERATRSSNTPPLISSFRSLSLAFSAICPVICPVISKFQQSVL